jgi:hypothetical protein
VAPLPVAARVDVAERPPQVEASEEDDLRERIRLAAQRAIAESNAPKTIPPKPVAPKTIVPKIPAPKVAALAVSAAKKVQPPTARSRKTDEPKIFVPPRAPDDPGPELTGEGDGVEFGPFRPTGAKA